MLARRHIVHGVDTNGALARGRALKSAGGDDAAAAEEVDPLVAREEIAVGGVEDGGGPRRRPGLDTGPQVHNIALRSRGER